MSENQKKLSNSFWVGVIVLTIGSLLLFDRMDLMDFPRWLFPWGILIVAGVIVGINKRFQGVGWLVMILIGTFFMLDHIPGFPYDLDDYGAPVIIIIVGLFILSRAVMGGASKEKRDFWQKHQHEGLVASDEGGEDYFDIVTVFGGAKRKVFSKNFKGGEATCIFGGVEVDLSQADIESTVVIDATQIFGGMKLLVPANWELKSDAVAIFGSVEDKRMAPQSYAGGKKLVITGFVMFGGIDIKSF
jgi:predicted membrane protein